MIEYYYILLRRLHHDVKQTQKLWADSNKSRLHHSNFYQFDWNEWPSELCLAAVGV